jgi:DNA-binding MarR family transcriptional regulator
VKVLPVAPQEPTPDPMPVPERPTRAGSLAGHGPNRDAFEALTEMGALMRAGLQQALQEFDLAAPYGHALAKIDVTVSMKELGRRLHCDPSFVTAIADMLEARGLVRREIDRADRRVKNLVLTPRGLEAREALERDFYQNLPGIRRLSPAEHEQFVALLRKMVAAEGAPE